MIYLLLNDPHECLSIGGKFKYITQMHDNLFQNPISIFHSTVVDILRITTGSKYAHSEISVEKTVFFQINVLQFHN